MLIRMLADKCFSIALNDHSPRRWRSYRSASLTEPAVRQEQGYS